MLARDRYNLLDIHGPCDAVSLDFPNAFAYFVTLPDFPQVGVGAEQAAKNMKRLQWIIQQAANRGIKVAYMNYEASAPIGAWRSRKFGVDERWTPMPQEFLSGEQLEHYTREAVASFLHDLPGLWMFGFESESPVNPRIFIKRLIWRHWQRPRPAYESIYEPGWLIRKRCEIWPLQQIIPVEH